MSSRLIKFLDVVDCIFIKLNTSSNILHEISKAAIYNKYKKLADSFDYIKEWILCQCRFTKRKN